MPSRNMTCLFQAYAIMDTVMEHLAVTSGLDPVDFRSANMNSAQHPLPEMITKLKQGLNKIEF